MRKTRSDTTTLSIKVPASLSARLATVAGKRRVPVSVVVREALEEVGKSSEAFFGELASDSYGRFSGPEDLSTNPRHLRPR